MLKGAPDELRAPIHERIMTFLEPRDYEEYLAPAERRPVHLLRILSAEMMRTIGKRSPDHSPAGRIL